jgi:hypothetical protein
MKTFDQESVTKGVSALHAWVLLAFCSASFSAMAQKTLSPVTVTAPAYTSHHGGYLISGDFKTDPRIPSVVFPSQALVKDDVLSVEPVHLADTDYLVVQECATADCTVASIVRVWNADGAKTAVRNSEDRIQIQHENKYWIWVKHFPEAFSAGCDNCGEHYNSFEPFSPPMVLVPSGQLAAMNKDELAAARAEEPVQIESQTHDGSTFVVTYDGGTIVRIRRMHADHIDKSEH